jgi:hypothetical protein
MLFRPKEIDTSSGEGPVLRPLAQWDISVRADFQRNLAFNNTIAYEYSDGISAIQAEGIDLHRFTRENLADR